MIDSHNTSADVVLPPALQRKAHSVGNRITVSTFHSLAATLISLATIPNLPDCEDLKLVDECHVLHRSELSEPPRNMRPRQNLGPCDIFSHLCRLLVGTELLADADDGNITGNDTLMVSDFGWTVILPSFGDGDPFIVTLESVHVRKGVPTNSKTMERRNRVRDAVWRPPETDDLTVMDPVLDRGKPTYRPRCVSPVLRRTEYYTTRKDAFHLTIKFNGYHMEHLNAQGLQHSFESYHGNRKLHEYLWQTNTAPPCPHMGNERNSKQGPREAKLGMGDVAALAGVWSWPDTKVTERIVVVLVDGDKRARWLALANRLTFDPRRKVMIRGDSSCEDCALEATTALSGYWMLVI